MNVPPWLTPTKPPTWATWVPGWKEQRKKEVGQENLVGQILGQGPAFGTQYAGKYLAKGLSNTPVALRMPFDANQSGVSSDGIGLPHLNIKKLQELAGLHLDTHNIPTGASNVGYLPPFMRNSFGGAMSLGNAPHGGVAFMGNFANGAHAPADVYAHELGHAMNWNGKAGVLPKVMMGARYPGLMAAGLSQIWAFRGARGDKPMEEREKLLNRASWIAGLGMAPVLGDEASATYRGLNLLRQANLNKMQMALARNRLLRAGGTYGLTATGLVLGPQLAKHYYQQHQ